MRFVIIGPTYPFRGGIAHHTSFLYHHLKQSHDVSLLSFSRQYPKWLVSGRDQSDPSQLPVAPTPCEYLIDFLNPITWHKAVKSIQHIQPDLVIIQWWVPFWSPPFTFISHSLRRNNIDVLYLCHNIFPHERHFFDRFLVKMALQNGNHFIVQSLNEEQQLKQLFPTARAHFVHLPIYDMFSTQMTRQEARRQLGFKKDDRVMLFFGFVRKYKGLDILLEAMGRLDLDHLYLIVAGEFWQDLDEYQAQIQRLELGNAVRLENRYIPDEALDLYFSAADVLVAPYRQTSQSAVVQLAYGFGCPVIATQLESMAGVVENQVNGLLVPPNNPNALADAINRFFQEGLQEQLAKGVIANRNRFSWDHLVTAIEKSVRTGKKGVTIGD